MERLPLTETVSVFFLLEVINVKCCYLRNAQMSQNAIGFLDYQETTPLIYTILPENGRVLQYLICVSRKTDLYICCKCTCMVCLINIREVGMAS